MSGSVNMTNGHIDNVWPNWIDVKFKLPEKDGGYLCIYHVPGFKPSIGIYNFANNLYNIDSSDFWDKKEQAGWWEYDDEYGCLEVYVSHWMPLPPLP